MEGKPANMAEMTSSSSQMCDFHTLSDKWVLYAHLPHDTNWSIDSYKSILEFNSVEQSLSLFEAIPDIMINNCMLFLMRNEVKPIWEDKHNRDGGCFSFKVSNQNVASVWRNLCYSTIGETASNDGKFMKNVNGITISPKRNFCILKIWTRNCDFTNVNSLIDINGMNKNDVLFKKHNPEY
jgi:hypothetical protein